MSDDKNMGIYAIMETLRKRKTPVFTTAEIARAYGTTRACARVYVKRMLERELIFRVAKGIYSLENDPILYASYVIPNSYISFNSALYLHGIIDQIPARISVAVPKNVKKKVDGVEFAAMPQKAIFGFGEMEYKGYFIWGAEPEKAIADIEYKYGKADYDAERIDARKITADLKRMRAGKKAEMGL